MEVIRKKLKKVLVRVVIHEVGHNFFPMIVSTDERQWAWMDEGFDTFVGFLAENSWDSLYEKRSTPAAVATMADEKVEPVMSYPDNALNYSMSSYFKPAIH